MSAPDSSNSKAPPSLLSDKAKGADGNSSRILANLEGRVAPPSEKPRRSSGSRLPLVLIALLVIGAGGWGAWHMQQRVRNSAPEMAEAGSPAHAMADKAADKNAAAVAATPASGASGAATLAVKADAPAAASSQAATIVADDSDSDKSNDKSRLAAPNSASAGGDDNRLSRALADGAEPSTASEPLAAAAGASAAVVSGAKSEKDSKSASAAAGRAKHDAAAARNRHEMATAANRHASAPAVIAQAKKPHAVAKNNNTGTAKDDSDADLLAALVARTKPADVKPAAGSASTRVSASASAASAKLAERVKECSQRGFFEDQLCRWRVCDGHWGKDPACPSSAQQARQP